MNSNCHFVVVNGHPRAGKDTAVKFMKVYLEQVGCASGELSYIDPVRKMLQEIGIHVWEKTDATRDLHAEVATALEKHSNFMTDMVMERAVDIFDSHQSMVPCVVFAHVRRLCDIERLRELSKSHGFEFHTVKVRSDREKRVESNEHDRDIDRAEYDHVIVNNDTLASLMYNCGKTAAAITGKVV